MTAEHAVESPLSIAHIGAFSMPNWGDKLYPGVMASMLSSVGLPFHTSYFAPIRGETSAGDPINKLRHVHESGADVALVGGGDVLRFDRRTVALDHLSIPTADRGSRIASLRARWFAQRHFLGGPGPWVPDKPWLRGRPAILISVGVHTVPSVGSAQRAVCQYRAAWVRTQNGSDRLTGAGVPRERIIVAPDMVFALPEMLEPDRTRARGEAILRDRFGLTELPLLFQATEFHGWPVERVAAALVSLKDLPVATFALGSYAGEDRLLRAAADQTGTPMLEDLSTDDITAILAAAGAVFTTSMHAAIVAASFGTPSIVPGVGKTKDAFEVCPNPPTLHAASDATLPETARGLLGRRIPHSVDANREAAVTAFRATLRAGGLT